MKNRITRIYICASVFSFLLSMNIFSQSKDTIATVKIGNQEWMAKNLDVVTFRNGDTIPEAKTVEEWQKASKELKPAWCYQANLPENGLKYGKLYNWHAVNDPRGLAPKGYHVPSRAEWDSLVSFIGGEHEKLISTKDWSLVDYATNESGFSGLPAGSRDFKGVFCNDGNFASWWSSFGASLLAWDFRLNYSSTCGGDYAKGSGLSVRCLLD